MSAKNISTANGADGLFIKTTVLTQPRSPLIFYMPLKAETAARYALCRYSYNLRQRIFPIFQRLNYKLDKLYGANLDASAEKVGDYQLLKIRISVINDRFTFESSPYKRSGKYAF